MSGGRVGPLRGRHSRAARAATARPCGSPRPGGRAIALAGWCSAAVATPRVGAPLGVGWGQCTAPRGQDAS
eukprot:3313205-Prymnesium_polylepis.1